MRANRVPNFNPGTNLFGIPPAQWRRMAAAADMMLNLSGPDVQRVGDRTTILSRRPLPRTGGAPPKPSDIITVAVVEVPSEGRTVDCTEVVYLKELLEFVDDTKIIKALPYPGLTKDAYSSFLVDSSPPPEDGTYFDARLVATDPEDRWVLSAPRGGGGTRMAIVAGATIADPNSRFIYIRYIKRVENATEVIFETVPGDPELAVLWPNVLAGDMEQLLETSDAYLPTSNVVAVHEIDGIPYVMQTRRAKLKVRRTDLRRVDCPV